MKKLIVLLACCLMVGGCTGNGPNEYTLAEIANAFDNFTGTVYEEIHKLNEVEVFGASDNAQNRYRNQIKVYNKYTDEVMKDSEIPQGQKVVVSGYIDQIMTLDEMLGENAYGKEFGEITFKLKDDMKEAEVTISCRTNDKSFLELTQGEPVTIEATYMKQGSWHGTSDSLFDCSIQNRNTAATVAEDVELIDGFERANFDKFNSYASKNGLKDTKVFIDGVVEEKIVVGDTVAFSLKDGENLWIIVTGELPEYDEQNVDKIVGESVRIFGFYTGYSETVDMPVVHCDYEGARIVLSDTTIENESNDNMYNTSGLVSKTIGEVQFKIPSSWDKDIKENDDFIYYYYDKLMFSTHYTTALDVTNDEFITESNAFVDGLKSGYDEYTEDKINIIDISNTKAIEFLANVTRERKNMDIKVLSFIYNEKLYSFAFYVEKDAKKDYAKEYESFKESIILPPGKEPVASYAQFKQEIIDMTKDLKSTDMVKQLYYNELVKSLPDVKVLTVDTIDSDSFNRFLVAIGYFYTHYEDGTKGHVIGEQGFLIVEALMDQGNADVESTVQYIEDLLSESESELTTLNDTEEIIEQSGENKENIEPIQLTTGRYVVGEDIPAGKYDIVGVKKGNVYVSSPGKDFADILNERITPGETTYANVKLVDGCTVEIVLGGEIQLQPK